MKVNLIPIPPEETDDIKNLRVWIAELDYTIAQHEIGDPAIQELTKNRNWLCEQLTALYELKQPRYVVEYDGSSGIKLTANISEETRQQFERQLNEKFIFEPNDTFTRSAVRNMVNEMMNELGTINSFEVICDATNNPPSVVDQGMLKVDIYEHVPDYSIIGVELFITKPDYDTAYNYAMGVIG